MSKQSIALIAFTLLTSNFSWSINKLIGYGSSTAVISSKIQEGFLMGYQLGFDFILGENKSLDIVNIIQDTSGSPLGAKKVFNTLIEQGAIAITGFAGSHDSMLVSERAKELGLLTIFIDSGHSGLGLRGPNVLTTGLPMKNGLEKAFAFIKKQFPKKKGLILINPSAVFSVDQYNLLKMIKSVDTELSFEFGMLNKQLKLDSQDLIKLKNKEYSYVFLTPYPEELIPSLNQFASELIDIPYVTGGSWGTAEPDILRRFLVNKKAPVFMIAEWIRGTPDSELFERIAEKKYGKAAVAEVVFGFEVGEIIAQIVKRVKGPLTKESLISALNQDRCFFTHTVGKLCFPKEGGHATRPVQLTRFTKDGFVRIK